jgi:Fe2+ transport system protein FeoA
MSAVTMKMPLSEIQHLNEVVVVDVEDDAHNAGRLQEMGFIPGSIVSLSNRSLFGGPSAFHVGDTKIALRQSDARRIHVALAA